MMRNFTLLLLLISTFCFSQMPNISSVWLNDQRPYRGTIGSEKTVLKVKIDLSNQDKIKDQEYFVSGSTTVEKNFTNFEGKISISTYKNTKNGGKIFGSYEFLEEPKGKHAGIFKGKFIYTFKFNKKTQKIESEYLQFVGNWESYDQTLYYKTSWTNQ